jgi:hypothetical protein
VHPGVPAAAAASQDYELGILGLVDQPGVRDVTDQSSVHLHVWVAFLPAGQSFTSSSAPSSPKVLQSTPRAGKTPSGTPRREASSKASVAAASDAVEPSISTRTGASPTSGSRSQRCWRRLDTLIIAEQTFQPVGHRVQLAASICRSHTVGTEITATAPDQ